MGSLYVKNNPCLIIGEFFEKTISRVSASKGFFLVARAYGAEWAIDELSGHAQMNHHSDAIIKVE